MAVVDKDTAAEHVTLEGFEGHYGKAEGYTIGFERYDADDDPSPLFKGLPDDRCQAAHWGVVLNGTYAWRNADGSVETVEAGQAYYTPPGHLPLFKAGTEIVEFSPTAEFDRTVAQVMKNLDAMNA